MNMENWYFMLIPVILIAVFLTVHFFKIKRRLKGKSSEIKQKIEVLKVMNRHMEDKQINTSLQFSQISQIFKQMTELHKLVFHKYFK